MYERMLNFITFLTSLKITCCLLLFMYYTTFMICICATCLHTWLKANLIIVYDLFNWLFNSTFNDFSIYIYQ
jgi:hypothetical protein